MTVIDNADIIILGAGMAGASLAAELGTQRRVLLIEVEDQPGRHATGRSAAMFFESYGNNTVRALTRASRGFLETPPDGFADVRLMSPRAAMIVADNEGLSRLEAQYSGPSAPVTMQRLTPGEALALVPILRKDWLAGAFVDDSGCDMDVAAIHQGYLRVARRARTQLVPSAGEVVLYRSGGLWHVRCRAGDFSAPVLVNATGAWADKVARQAGAALVGLQPMRRTALTIPAPAGLDSRAWPMVITTSRSRWATATCPRAGCSACP